MRLSLKTIISGVVGNALENYDYVLYANFAVIISKVFFPESDLYNSLLAAFGVFAAGFVTRPLGAIIFGHVGDKYSRKAALSISIMLMSFPTALIGITPSYEKIGIFAPIILVAIRMMQGLSIGGETSSFMTYLMESSPESKNKAWLGSLAFVSTALGLFFGFLAVFICNFYFSEVDWAWRVPFLLSLPIGIIGFYIRSKLDEAPEFKDLKSKNLLAKVPLFELFKNYKKNFFFICSLFISISIPFYVFFGFLATFLVKVLGYSQLQISLIYLVCTIAYGCFAMLSGVLADRFGMYKVLVGGISLFALFLFVIFSLILSENFISTFCGCLLFVFLSALYQGSIPSIIIKIFPMKVRAVGTALSFNLVSVLFGGLAPLTLSWLIKLADSAYVVPYYMVVFSLISLIGLVLGRKFKLV